MNKKLKRPDSVKAKVWRELEGYNPLKDEIFDYDGVVEKLALIYGVSKEEIEENFELSDLLPEFLDCVSFVNRQVIAKLNEIPKKKVETQ